MHLWVSAYLGDYQKMRIYTGVFLLYISAIHSHHVLCHGISIMVSTNRLLCLMLAIAMSPPWLNMQLQAKYHATITSRSLIVFTLLHKQGYLVEAAYLKACTLHGSAARLRDLGHSRVQLQVTKDPCNVAGNDPETLEVPSSCTDQPT